MSSCEVTVEPGEPPVVVVTGEVNYESAPRIRQALAEFSREGRWSCVVDCRAVDFIDSSGIGVIVHAALVMKKAGGSLTLRAPTSQLMHALQVSGFAQLVHLEEGFAQTPVVDRCEAREPVSWQQAKFSVPAHADQDGLVRQRITDLACAMPFTPDQIDDIRLAVGEAASNAVRHGCHKKHDRLGVHCTGDSEKLVVRITSPSRSFDPGQIPDPDPASPREGGMGIFFMKASMDSVRFSFDEHGTTVTMVKYLGK